MGKKGTMLATAVIIAVAAVVYFGFFFPPARDEDLSGTIGAVQKYRAEQISDQDVVLQGHIDLLAEATEEQKAALFDNAPLEDKVDMLKRSPVWKTPYDIFHRLEAEDQVATLERSPIWKTELEGMFHRLEAEDQVAALEKSPVWKTELEGMFHRLEAEDQVAALERSPVWKTPKTIDGFLGRMLLEQKVETIERSPVWKTPVELFTLLESMPEPIRADMFGRLEYAIQAATIQDAYAGQAMEL